MTRLLTLLVVLVLAVHASAQSLTARRVTSRVPPGTVTIQPGESLQSAITANADGTTFLLKAGTHRITGSLTPKAGITFLGEWDRTNTQRLTIINGARLLTGWSGPSGGRWSISGQTQGNTVGTDPSECKASDPRCQYPEQLFFDCATPATCVMKYHEDALADVGAGEWFFDYAANVIYVGDDPNGHTVETSLVDTLFAASTVDNVTVRDLVIEKFANPVGTGAITLGSSAMGSEGWMADNVEVRYNHGDGIYVDTNSRVRGSYIHHNCQYGINGAGSGIVIDGNEIAFNNVLPQYQTAGAVEVPTNQHCGFDEYFNSGSTKFVFTTNMIVRGNFSHHNYGNGLWTDIANIGTLYEGNHLYYNRLAGIFHEVSCDAIIRRNYSQYNGYDNQFPGSHGNAGILVATSPNVEVYENVLENNTQGIAAVDDTREGSTGGGPCTWNLTNLNVHHNTVTSLVGTMDGRGRTGVWVIGTRSTCPYDAGQNNHFENNTYVLGSPTDYFVWNNGSCVEEAKTDSQWQTTYGNDDTGSITHLP